ncbi:MAG: DUF2339 domain-containing protein [Candidatus Buchananbacteria bacterium]
MKSPQNGELGNESLNNSQEIIRRLDSIIAEVENQNTRLKKLEVLFFQEAPEPVVKNTVEQKDELDKSLEQPVNIKAPVRQNNPVQNKQVRKDNIEEKIAGNWFAKIGILAVVIGVAFFLKYAFDNNWINEYGRIAIGVIVGGSFFALGIWLVKKYFVYGQVLAGGGLGILYLSFFAAYNFYHIISYPLAFLLISLVTIIGILISIYKNTPSLTYIAVIMAFLTPFLLWSSDVSQVGLFTYLLILDLAIIAVSLFKKEQVWTSLSWLGFVATELTFLVWQSAYWVPSQYFTTMIFLSLFFLIFSLFPIVKILLNKKLSTEESIASSLIVGGVFFLHAYFLMTSVSAHISVLPLFLALYYGALSFVAYSANRKNKTSFSILLFMALAFVAIFIPTYFHHQVITYFWLVELALVSFFASRFKNISYMVISVILGALVVIKLFTMDIVGFNGDFVWGGGLALFLAAAAVFYLCSWFFTNAKKESLGKEQASFFRTMQVFATIFATIFVIFIPTNFHGQVITYLWLIELAIFSAVGSYSKDVLYKIMPAILGIILIIKLLFIDLSLQGDFIFNGRLLLFICATIIFYLCSWFFTNAKKAATDKDDASYFNAMQISAITMASIFTIFAINKEIENYYGSTDMASIVLSIWWLVYSIIIIVIGFVGKFKKLRLGGLMLLSLAILKLFFYDLWNLGQLYRIISSIVLGLVLLLVSFGYQKYKHIIKDLI